MTRILAVGNYQHEWCSEVHFAREYESLGHTVTRLQEPPGGGSLGTLVDLESLVDRDRIELVTWTRTWGLPFEATDLWRRLEAKGVATMSLHLDLYAGLQRQGQIKDDPFWTTGTVFTPDGDPRSQAWFESQGIHHVYSPPGCVSDECVPGNFREELAYDVVFVGSPASAYHREWKHRGQLLHWLAKTYGQRFHRFGPGAERMRGQDLNDLYASAKVVVGDNLSMPGHRNYSTDRPWETVGRGGFLLQPYSPGMEDHFTDGEHLRWYQYGDFDGLRTLIDYYLDHQDEAREIAARGQAHVRATGTYRHRLERIIPIALANLPQSTGSPFAPTIEARPEPIRLELGSGTSPTPGFVHLDVNPNAPDVDIVGPAFPLDMPDQSVSELRCVDVLEHLSYRDTTAALAEWARVMVPGGRMYVQVPDADLVMRWFVESPHKLVERLPGDLPQTPLAGATWRIMGGHLDNVYATVGDDWTWNAHYAMFSAASLTEALDVAGFDVESLTTNGHPNLLCHAVRR